MNRMHIEEIEMYLKVLENKMVHPSAKEIAQDALEKTLMVFCAVITRMAEE